MNSGRKFATVFFIIIFAGLYMNWSSYNARWHNRILDTQLFWGVMDDQQAQNEYNKECAEVEY